jgi:hypothetical protein
MVISIAIVSMPFLVAETLTGVVSLLTGELSIPPVVGVGTAIELAILVSGLVAACWRALGVRGPGNAR